MDGKPFRVGRFAHTLRIRLMREHIGVDVDKIYQEEFLSPDPVKDEDDIETWDPDKQTTLQDESGITRVTRGRKHTPLRTVLGDAGDALHQGMSLRTGVILSLTSLFP